MQRWLRHGTDFLLGTAGTDSVPSPRHGTVGHGTHVLDTARHGTATREANLGFKFFMRRWHNKW